MLRRVCQRVQLATTGEFRRIGRLQGTFLTIISKHFSGVMYHVLYGFGYLIYYDFCFWYYLLHPPFLGQDYICYLRRRVNETMFTITPHLQKLLRRQQTYGEEGHVPLAEGGQWKQEREWLVPCGGL
jgi:hypothetical protein